MYMYINKITIKLLKNDHTVYQCFHKNMLTFVEL